MKVLWFEKPKKAMSKEAHQSISADGAPPGVYTPNMSVADRLKWKAKVVGSKSENFQVEIRSMSPRCNLLAIVNGVMRTGSRDEKPFEVKLSANGPMFFDRKVWGNFEDAIREARLVLALLDAPYTREKAMKEIRAGIHPLESE
jgi:hypothetical protein